MEFIYYLFAFVFGSVVGSFLNVVIYRLPREESIVFPASHCPICKEDIKWYDNIPILSYYLLKGRCRNCKSKISIQYPIVEFLTAAIFVLLMWKFGLSVTLISYIFFSCLIIAGSIIDLTTFANPPFVKLPVIISLPQLFISSQKHDPNPIDSLIVEGILQDEMYDFENDQTVTIPIEQEITQEKLPDISVKPIIVEKGIIPDSITFVGMFIGLILSLLTEITSYKFLLWHNNSLIRSVEGLIVTITLFFVISVIFKYITKRDGLGMGDVKFLGLIGIFLGLKLSILTIFLSSFIGLISILVMKIKKSEPFPFGPFLGLGSFISLFIGDKLINLLLAI